MGARRIASLVGAQRASVFIDSSRNSIELAWVLDWKITVLCMILGSFYPSLKGQITNLNYPRAHRGDVIDEYHGVEVPDPYRWMEDLDSPETRAWVISQAKLTEGYLSALPERTVLRLRLAELVDYEKFSSPIRRGDCYFFTRNKGLEPQSVLYTSAGLEAAPAVLLDPNQLSKDGSVALAGYTVSGDGKILAYGLSVGGGDWTDWHFRDVESGRDLPDVVRWTKYYQPVFSPQNDGVYYSRFPAPRAGEELSARDLGNAVWFHQFGTSSGADKSIFETPDHVDWQFDPALSPGSDWLVLTCGEGQVGDKGRMNVYLVELTGKRRVIPMAEGFEAAYIYVGADEGLLYFQTTSDSPKGRVVAVDPKQPARGEWKTVVAPRPDAMDFTSGSVTLVDHRLIVRTMHDVHTVVEIFSREGEKLRSLDLPGAGAAHGFGGFATDGETFFTYTDWITPSTIYRCEPASGKTSPLRVPHTRFDPTLYESKQVFYESKDGTRVPMFVVQRKGLRLDGSNPTLLYGYGGFGIPLLPSFRPGRIAWLEKGGVFAVANIRGGGEYGPSWHLQAVGQHRQVAFDDFIAAAEWLIKSGYTRTAKLAIEGGSNGGLLVGACLTQRPDLFGAALAYVGVMDMLRFDRFGQGSGWTGDFGSPQNPADFRALHAYSPYHNVRAGTRYPATLVITGDHDTRVMPAHSFKFAAALQAAQAGPAPILLKVHLSAGHGGGVTTQQRIEEEADAYAFLFANLGMEPRR